MQYTFQQGESQSHDKIGVLNAYKQKTLLITCVVECASPDSFRHKTPDKKLSMMAL